MDGIFTFVFTTPRLKTGRVSLSAPVEMTAERPNTINSGRTMPKAFHSYSSLKCLCQVVSFITFLVEVKSEKEVEATEKRTLGLSTNEIEVQLQDHPPAMYKRISTIFYAIPPTTKPCCSTIVEIFMMSPSPHNPQYYEDKLLFVNLIIIYNLPQCISER